MYHVYFYLFIFFGAISAVVSQFPGHVGVCNGRKGGNLPPEEDVVELYKAKGIKKMRIYSPHQATLTALRDSGIELILDVPNSDLPSLQVQAGATQWVQTNVHAHFPATKIRYIAVGNEVDPENQSSRFAPLVLPAMQRIHEALSDLGLQDQIKVSTATYSAVLTNTFPPSSSAFKDGGSFMPPIVKFLSQIRSPLLINIYPYFAYRDNSDKIRLDFALLTYQGNALINDRGLQYRNLFDAMVDGVYYALEKAGAGDVGVVVSESGWPSAGGGAAENVDNAATYYRNLIRHVGNGTPKRPGRALETYLFAMFDENRKTGEQTEQHFGLFNPTDETPKYNL